MTWPARVHAQAPGALSALPAVTEAPSQPITGINQCCTTTSAIAPLRTRSSTRSRPAGTCARPGSFSTTAMAPLGCL
jgi:hypothetical protein